MRDQDRGRTLQLILVDDDLDIRRAVASLLRSHGHEVRVFSSAEECLSRPVGADCAIVDIALPGISGLELYERLSALGKPAPVVFITAHDEREVLTAIQATGCPFLRKPIDEDGLLEAVERATRGRRGP